MNITIGTVNILKSWTFDTKFETDNYFSAYNFLCSDNVDCSCLFGIYKTLLTINIGFFLLNQISSCITK